MLNSSQDINVQSQVGKTVILPRGDLIVNIDDQINYVNCSLTQEEGELNMIKLAQTSRYEEAYLFDKTNSCFSEIGYNCTNRSCQGNNFTSAINGINLISYHLHPKYCKLLDNSLTAMFEKWMDTVLKQFLTEKDILNLKERMLTLPSKNDLTYFRNLQEQENIQEFRIANPFGITNVVLKEGNIEGIVKLYDKAISDYVFSYDSNINLEQNIQNYIDNVNESMMDYLDITFISEKNIR